MLIYYKLSGVNAVVALIFNLVILLGLMAYIGAVMTLPGIAGFVLTMGMGVDSNVLIFERIKEELEAQRGVRASINAGFSRVFLTLVDTHIGGADLGGVPVPVRHRADPRLRGHAVRRPAVEPVHLDVRVEDAVRAGAGAPASGRDAEYLSHAYFQEHELRLPALALARHRALRARHHRRASSTIATKGLHKGVEFAGGTVGHRAVRAAGVDRSRCARRSSRTFGGRTSSIQTYGDPSQRQVHDPRARRSAPNRAASLERDGRRRSRPRSSRRNLGDVQASSAPRSSARRSAAS